MTVFDSTSVDLAHLEPQWVSYAHKNIRTEAVQATRENIGQIALEFEVELFYGQNGVDPYFEFYAYRGTEQNPNKTTHLLVRIGDWIVPLWGELHVYRDYTFRNTFTFGNPPPFTVPREDVEQATVGSVPAMNLMEAAEQSSNPELRNFAGKLTNLRPEVVDLARKLDEPVKGFKENDRVFIEEGQEYGTVTVVGVETAEGRPDGIEVQVDRTGQKWVFDPEALRLAVDQPEGHSYIVKTDQHGITEYLPKVED